MTLIPVAEFAPDLPDLTGGQSAVIKNCLARTAASYGPMPSLVVQTSAINARCQGAVATQDTAANVVSFCGNATKLYKLASGGASWTDVSKVAGYSTGAAERWSFTYFNGKLLASNFADAIQSWTLGSSAFFADLAAAAPKARYITALAKGFAVAANTFDATSGNAPQRVWWSAFGDATSWPTPGSTAAAAVLSDYQDVTGDQGWCMGIVGNVGVADAAVFFERGVYRMVYSNAVNFFQFAPAEGVRGTPAPGSICQLSNLVFYIGEDGFYAFDGSSSAPIGAGKVDKFFEGDMDQNYFNRISSAVDPLNKIIYWAYPGSGNSMGNPNKIMAYNWELKRWTLIDGLNIELIFRNLAIGYTLEQLDTAFGTSIDAFTFDLDSRALTGGRTVLSAFDASHQLNTFSGSAMSPTVDSQEAQIHAPRRAFVRNVRPVTDGLTPSVSIGTRDRTQDAIAWGAATMLDGLGNCPQRSNARYHRARITLPAASTWLHISGVDFDSVPEGAR